MEGCLRVPKHLQKQNINENIYIYCIYNYTVQLAKLWKDSFGTDVNLIRCLKKWHKENTVGVIIGQEKNKIFNKYF